MAEDKELSQLETITNPSDDDFMYLVRGGNSRKIPYGSVFPKDDYYTKAQIDTALDGKADENEATPVSVSGNPITITDAANIPCESLSMTIEPIQSGSGTPSPTNVRPIIGLTEANAGTGNGVSINLASPTSSKGELTFTVIGTTIAGKSASAWNALKYNVSFTGNTTRRFKCHVKPITPNLKMRVFITNVNEQEPFPYDSGDIATETDLNVTFEAPAGTYELWLYGSRQTTFGDFVFGDIALYNDADVNTVTITFGETVYGGSVDFDSGIVTVKWVSGSITWFNRSNARQYWVRANPRAKVSTGNVYCDKLPKRNDADYGVSVDNMSALVFLFPDEYESATDAINAYGGSLQVVYELETYTKLTLTPAQLELLKGYNTVSANGATITLDYQKDNLAGDVKQWVEYRKEYYSTTEQKTNKVWIDGKPMYQKTFEAQSTGNITVEIDASDLDIDYFECPLATATNANYASPIYAYSSTDMFYVYYDRNTKKLNVTVSGAYKDVGSTFYITILYTKTTD